ncbi:MAG: hypothetical protein LBE78_08415, partial [Burkholderiaceae bacterium]|nr:hypothetical protein [Burkholderiaceae bacterium]
MANDKANGNKLGAGAARKVADTTPPKAPDVALVNDTGASDNDMLTRDGALALSGIESGAKLQYSTDGGATWKPKLKAQEGDNTVLVRQIDAAGNVSAPSAAVNFTLDKTPPKAPVAAFDMDSAAVLPIKLSRIEAGATVEYSADKGATWSTSFTPVLGDNTVQARQIDAAGNVSKPSAAVTFSYNWTGPLPVPEEPVSVDPLPPPPTAIATITAITDDTTGNDVAGPGVPRIGENDFVTWDQTLIVTAEVTGELAANEVVQISLDNGATWHNAEKVSGATWSYDAQNIVLAPGEYTFQARVSGVASSASKASTQVVKIGAYDLPDVPSFAIREYVDDVGPQTGNFSQGSVTNDTSPLLKGSWFILPWETPKIYDAESGAYLGDMKFSENIGWSFQLNDLA